MNAYVYMYIYFEHRETQTFLQGGFPTSITEA